MKTAGVENGNFDNKFHGPPGWEFGVRIVPYHNIKCPVSKSQHEDRIFGWKSRADNSWRVKINAETDYPNF